MRVTFVYDDGKVENLHYKDEDDLRSAAKICLNNSWYSLKPNRIAMRRQHRIYVFADPGMGYED